MRDIDSTFKEQKNKETNKPVRLYTIYDYDGAGTNLYLAEFERNLTYDGQEYVKFPVSFETIGENTRGEIDAIKLTLSNVSRLIQGYLETYNLRDKKVSIKSVWLDHLDDTDAYLEDIFYIDNYTADQFNVVFTLLSKYDVLDLNLPSERYSRNYCRYKLFKGTECGYSGAETTCNRTLQRCREIGNTGRFGGFPSIPQRRLIVG